MDTNLQIRQIPAIQDLAYCMGSEGCLFIVLCAIAEQISKQPIDLLRTARYCIDKGYMDYVDKYPRSHLKEAYYIKDRDKLLQDLTKNPEVTTRKVDALPKGYKGLYYMRYSYGTYTHFVLPNYNSMYSSNTVNNGKIDAYYLILGV